MKSMILCYFFYNALCLERKAAASLHSQFAARVQSHYLFVVPMVS